ncbi:hypothetical protein PENSPDRAFT_679244 [Peniophora sp. CONT]|nr:hypothetical protein PENSPDRAFT_679244 [Peniophora sp. CONT]
MLSLRSRKLALTLLCTLALAFALVEPAQAADPLALNRRDHANLNRMIKKRSPGLLDDINPVNNAGAADPSAASDSAAGSSTAASASDTAASSPAASQTAASSTVNTDSAASSSTASSTTSSTSSTASSTTSSSASTTSTTSSTTTSSATSSSTTSSAAPTTSAAPGTSAAAAGTTPAAVAAQDNSAEAVTITSHVTASAAPTSSASAKAATNTSSLSKGAITTLAVIAGCIGGGALIWTIFRKWKLRTSKRFDDRLAPIDWQPPTENDDVPGSNRRASIASSFHSAGHDGLVRAPSSSSSHGFSAYGATGQHAPSLQPLPEHDFTAGAASGYLGPNAGYADLARGPSPGPQMQDLSRGPSFNHGYGAYPQQQQAPAGAYDYNNAHY